MFQCQSFLGYNETRQTSLGDSMKTWQLQSAKARLSQLIQFIEFITKSPLSGSKIGLKREKSLTRDIDL